MKSLNAVTITGITYCDKYVHFIPAVRFNTAMEIANFDELKASPLVRKSTKSDQCSVPVLLPKIILDDVNGNLFVESGVVQWADDRKPNIDGWFGSTFLTVSKLGKPNTSEDVYEDSLTDSVSILWNNGNVLEVRDCEKIKQFWLYL